MSSRVSQPATEDEGWWKSIRKHLNFYRVHILFFTFTPLIFSGIFYASNGQYHISYINSLFSCVSAMTVCGLATVNLSSLTRWQQGILLIQMCLGSPVAVSWVMVYIRKYYFARKFEHIVLRIAARQAADAEKRSRPWPNRIATFLRSGTSLPVVPEENPIDQMEKENKGGIIRKLRPDMIRRMDDAPKLINPSGWVSEGRAVQMKRMPTLQSRHEPNRFPGFAGSSSTNEYPPARPLRRANSQNSPPIQELVNPSSGLATPDSTRSKKARRLSDPGIPSRPPSPVSTPMQRFETVAEGLKNDQHAGFPRTHTVEFAPSVPRRRGRPDHYPITEHNRPDPEPNQHDESRSMRRPSLGPQVSLTTHLTSHTQYSTRRPTKHRGFGGFPMPFEIVTNLIGRFFPKMKRKLTRTVTIPATTSLVSQGGNATDGAKSVPYISFDAIVGRNSAFHLLTNEQLEELGGVEYRALNVLLWIVAGYHIGLQLLAYIVIAPYMSMSRWSQDFLPPEEQRPVPSAWFSFFQVISSYTNTGTSLVDQSMVPFQTAYPMVIIMGLLILAGNTAFPIFLRFTIWIITKLVPERSRANETLHFLLDHPRRCFIYLFPSHQTWFLFTIVVFLTFIDWFFFLILDIGVPGIDLPLGLRFLAGWFQAIAVRAAGFGIVPLAALAPAVKVLYVVMMYISVYPIAMSVRSTNVYEEQSLGVYPDDDDSDDEDEFVPSGPRMTVWSKYLAMHARRQLAFDMWWLALALFVVCIIERANIDDEASLSWFTVFNIIFELVSAYGTVGLSLGIPTENYSLSGAFRPLSKLVVCLVMLRGRHRGLPVAIDRAVMLPREFGISHEELADVRSQQQSTSSHVQYSTGFANAMDDGLIDEDVRSERQQRYRSRRRSMEEAYLDETTT